MKCFDPEYSIGTQIIIEKVQIKHVIDTGSQTAAVEAPSPPVCALVITGNTNISAARIMATDNNQTLFFIRISLNCFLGNIHKTIISPKHDFVKYFHIII